MRGQLKRAAELLRREAKILRECNPNTRELWNGTGGDWNGNEAAKQDHDELLDAADIVDKAIERIAELERQAAIGRRAIDSAALDALDNLIHDNYERSQCGYRDRQADAGLVRSAILRDSINAGFLRIES